MKLSGEQIVSTLEENGFEALYVGGIVRDKLLDVSSNDIDIATNATIDELIHLFSPLTNNIDYVGKNYGVLIVDEIEVVMYRSEEYHSSKPTVQYTTSFYEDSSRRDFTINAMGENSKGDIIDYHNGIDDIQNKVIRFVGNPYKRIEEDASRILRAFYFASRFQFTIETNTLLAIKEKGHLLQDVPNALKGKIIRKVIKHNNLSYFVRLLNDSDLLAYVFTELTHTINQPQNPKYHQYDVFEHILKVIESAENRYPSNSAMIMSGLLHDCAKALPHIRDVNVQGQPNDIGHEDASADIALTVLNKYEFDKEVKDTVYFIIKFHGFRLNAKPKRKSILKVLRAMCVYTKNKAELQRLIELVFDFMTCDADGFNNILRDEVQSLLPIWRQNFKETLLNQAFYPSDLPVNGKDIQSYGFKGIEIGEMISKLIELNKVDRGEAISYLHKQSTN